MRILSNRYRLAAVGLLASLALVAACDGASADDAAGASTSIPACPPEPAKAPPDDKLSYTRILRRVSLTLTGLPPSIEDYEAIAAAPSNEAKDALIEAAVEQALGSPDFYTTMLTFGHDWIKNGEYTTGAQGESYQGNMSGDLATCPAATKHAGAFYSISELGEDGAVGNVCNDLDLAGAPRVMEVSSVEPWWAPGTSVTIIGKAGTSTRTVTGSGGKTIDCGVSNPGYYDFSLPPGCGCGPNLTYCIPTTGFGGSDSRNESTQRRKPWEEPARLFAHLAWHDRPLSDLVLGNYTVGDNMLRALYVRMARQNGAGSAALDANTTWWKASGPEPRDPIHTVPNDPGAWREFVVEKLNPFFLSLTPDGSPSGSADRHFAYDPRTTKVPLAGIPTAGVLTMMGTLSSFARERPRAARFLEIFACHNFVPAPASQKFNAYDGDPATSGTCQQCHQALDPAAIHFKRWDFGHGGYVPLPFIPGVGPWRVTKEQLSGQYPYSSVPFTRWRDSFKPNTILTPISQAEYDANPESVFLDTMPPSQTLLGQKSDGTMGPLGFGKILVASGEFDRCATQRLYERFVGHPLDTSTESGYLQLLTAKFLEGGRKLRPFVRYLMSLAEFRRGL